MGLRTSTIITIFVYYRLAVAAAFGVKPYVIHIEHAGPIFDADRQFTNTSQVGPCSRQVDIPGRPGGETQTGRVSIIGNLGVVDLYI